MYYVKLNDEVISTTEDLIVAMINYRYLLHSAHLSDNKYIATMLENSDILYQHKINTQTAQMKFEKEMSTNHIFLELINKQNLSVNDLKAIIKETGLNVSNSKISGWLSQADNRRYQIMYNDELLIMLKAILDYYNIEKSGYSPENLKKLIKYTRLSNAEFSRKFDIPINTLSANISDVENSKHRSMSYKTWIDLIQKVKKFMEHI